MKLRHIARLTANLLRPVPIGELAVDVKVDYMGRNAGHPLPMAPREPDTSPVAHFPFTGGPIGYADLVETRLAQGTMWQGPCAVWFRMRHRLVEGEAPSPYQRVAVAADSGNGISAVLDYERSLFVNSVGRAIQSLAVRER